MPRLFSPPFRPPFRVVPSGLPQQFSGSTFPPIQVTDSAAFTESFSVLIAITLAGETGTFAEKFDRTPDYADIGTSTLVSTGQIDSMLAASGITTSTLVSTGLADSSIHLSKP